MNQFHPSNEVALDAPTGKLHQLVEEYFAKYLTFHHIDPRFLDLSLYGQIIESVLLDFRVNPKNEPELARALQSVFHRRKVLDIGCRRGLFLHFLRSHGAKVMGTTSEKYLQGAKQVLGKKTIVVESDAQSVGNQPAVRKFKPDFVFSSNLMDENRWREKDLPAARIYHSLYRVVTPKTLVYVLPSYDSHSHITPEQVMRRRRIKDFKSSLLLSRGADRFNLEVMGQPNFLMRFRIRKKKPAPKPKH